MARRKPKPPEEVSAEAQHLNNALNDGSDISCVLIGAASLEQALVSLLSKHFVAGDTSKSLFDLNGVLSDFSKCAKIAYCLGLIPKHFYSNLNQIAEIRNLFAHSPKSLDFATEEIVKLCKRIELPRIFKVSSLNVQDASPRSQFSLAVVMMWSRIVLCALGEQRRPDCPYDW